MKKIVNGIVLLILVVLIVLSGVLYSKIENTSIESDIETNVGNDETEQDIIKNSGFERHEDLAKLYVESMLNGDSENLVDAMSEDIIADIAVENFVPESVIRSALLAWYNRENSYIDEWLYDNFTYPESISWHISEVHWSEEEEMDDLDYGFGIAGYDYTGLRRLGVTNVLYYGASISVADNSGMTDGFSLHFAVAELNGLWYLIGID